MLKPYRLLVFPAFLVLGFYLRLIYLRPLALMVYFFEPEGLE
jgi:hypothetical protein